MQEEVLEQASDVSHYNLSSGENNCHGKSSETRFLTSREMLTLFGWTREKFVYAAFGLVSGGAMKVQNEKTTGGPDRKLDNLNPF